MNPNTKTTATKKQGWLSYGLEHLLFSENIWIRFFRVWIILVIIAGWGFLGALVFEVDPNGLTISDVLRYALVPFAATTGAFLLGARYLQDIYELPSYRSALHYLFASMFDGPPYFFVFSGKFLPTLNISDGKPDSEEGEVNLLQQIGGPGWLSVEAGNVILLEYLHSPSRVLGPGFHFVPRMQHVEGVFSLEDQRWEAGPIVATTKDGIEVAVHDFQFGYRLATPPHGKAMKKRTTTDPFPFSAKAVLKLAYNRSVKEDGRPMEWGKVAQFRLDGVITDLINKYSIDKILAPIIGNSRDYSSDKDESLSEKDSRDYTNDKDKSIFERDTREMILTQINSPHLREMIKNYLGTEISWVNIGRFEINDEKIERDIKAYRLKAWFAQLAGKAELIRAEGKAEQISQIESGRIEKTTSMLRGILQALADANLEGDEIEHLWNIVLARSAQVIEAMVSLDTKDILDFENEGNAKKGVI